MKKVTITNEDSAVNSRDCGESQTVAISSWQPCTNADAVEPSNTIKTLIGKLYINSEEICDCGDL